MVTVVWSAYLPRVGLFGILAARQCPTPSTRIVKINLELVWELLPEFGTYSSHLAPRDVAIKTPDWFGLHLAERDGYYTEVIPIRVLRAKALDVSRVKLDLRRWNVS